MRIIPRSPNDLLWHFASGAAIHYSLTALENYKLSRHYHETRTPLHQRHMRSWRMVPWHEKVGRTVGTIAMSPNTPVAAAAGVAAVGIATGTVVNEMTRRSINSSLYTTPYTSGFGSVV